LQESGTLTGKSQADVYKGGVLSYCSGRGAVQKSRREYKLEEGNFVHDIRRKTLIESIRTGYTFKSALKLVVNIATQKETNWKVNRSEKNGGTQGAKKMSKILDLTCTTRGRLHLFLDWATTY